jgi:hypothetical protein
VFEAIRSCNELVFMAVTPSIVNTTNMIMATIKTAPDWLVRFGQVMPFITNSSP